MQLSSKLSALREKRVLHYLTPMSPMFCMMMRWDV